MLSQLKGQVNDHSEKEMHRLKHILYHFAMSIKSTEPLTKYIAICIQQIMPEFIIFFEALKDF